MDSLSSTPTHVSYWDNILLSHKAEKIIPDDILQKFCTYINNGEYHTLDLDEKYRITIDGVHWVVRSARLSDAKRVLFTDQGPNLIILDYLPNHEYSKSAVMESQWFRQFVSSRLGRHQRPEDFIQVVMEPLPMAPSIAIPRGAVYSYNHVDFNFLDSHQSHILSSDLPIITVGPAGTGKTLASRELFYSRIEGHLYSSDLSEVLNLAYFTSARVLSNNERKIAERQSFADSPWVSIDYWHDELRYPRGQTTYRTALFAWTRKQIQETPILDSLSPEQLLEEFDLLFVLERIAGKAQAPTLYTDPRDGFARAKLFPHKEKQLPVVLSLFSMFIAEFFENPRQPYVQGFRSALPTDKIYAVATYDESQNASLSEIYEAFVLCQGRLSILYDPKQAQKGLGRDTVSLFENIVNQLHPFHRSFQPRLELQQNYRCGLKQLELCNQLLRLRAWALKGVTIKDEAPLINLPIQDHANGSRVFWYNSFEDTHYQTEVLPHLSKDSADWATITDPSYFSEVRTYIGEEPILMGYQQIPGVEFKVTQIYHPIHPDLLTPELLEFLETALDPTAPLPISLAKLENRTKYAELLKWIGQIFTAITRSMHTTIIIQPDVQLKHKKVFRKLVQLLALPQSLDRTQKMLISLTGSSIARWQEVVLGLREDPVLAQNLYDRHLAQETGQTFTEWLSFIAPAIDESPTLQIDTSMPYSETLSCSSASASASTSTEITPTSSIRRNKPRKKSSATSPKLDYAQLKKHVLIFCQAKRASDLKALQNCSALHLVNMLFLETLLPSSSATELVVAQEYSPSNTSIFEMYMQNAPTNSTHIIEKFLLSSQYLKELITSKTFMAHIAPPGLTKILQPYLLDPNPEGLATMTVFDSILALIMLSTRPENAIIFFKKSFELDLKAPHEKMAELLAGHILRIDPNAFWIPSVEQSTATVAFKNFWNSYIAKRTHLQISDVFPSLTSTQDISHPRFKTADSPASPLPMDSLSANHPNSSIIHNSSASDDKTIFARIREELYRILSAAPVSSTDIFKTTLQQQFNQFIVDRIEAGKSSNTDPLFYRFLSFLIRSPLTNKVTEENYSSHTLFTYAMSRNAHDIVFYLLKCIDESESKKKSLTTTDTPVSCIDIIDLVSGRYGPLLLELLRLPRTNETRRHIIIYSFILSIVTRLGASLHRWLISSMITWRIFQELLSERSCKTLAIELAKRLSRNDRPNDISLKSIFLYETTLIETHNDQTLPYLRNEAVPLMLLACKQGESVLTDLFLHHGAQAAISHKKEGTALYHAIQSQHSPEKISALWIRVAEYLTTSLQKEAYLNQAQNAEERSAIHAFFRMHSENLESPLKLDPTLQTLLITEWIPAKANFLEPLNIPSNGDSPKLGLSLAFKSDSAPEILEAMLQCLPEYKGDPKAEEVLSALTSEAETIGASYQNLLLVALEAKRYKIALILLKYNVGILYTSPTNSLTALMFACQPDAPPELFLQILSKLKDMHITQEEKTAYLDLAGSFNDQPSQKVCPLSLAITHGHRELFDALLDAGCSISSYLVLQVIEHAVSFIMPLLNHIENQVAKGIWSIEQQIEFVNPCASRYDSAIFYACESESYALITKLLAMGAEIPEGLLMEVMSSKDERIPLMLLEHIDRLESVQKSEHICTMASADEPFPLFAEAMAVNRYRVAEKLIDMSSASTAISDSIIASDAVWQYVLNSPCALFERILEILAKTGDLSSLINRQFIPEVNSRVGLSQTPLEYCIISNRIDSAQILIEKEADLFGQKPSEPTILTLACQKTFWGLAQSILDKLRASRMSQESLDMYLLHENIEPNKNRSSALTLAFSNESVSQCMLSMLSAIHFPKSDSPVESLCALLARAAQIAPTHILRIVLERLQKQDDLSRVINASFIIDHPHPNQPPIEFTPLIASIYLQPLTAESPTANISLLLEFGAIPTHIPMHTGISPLIAATLDPKTEIIDFLLSKAQSVFENTTDFKNYLSYVSPQGVSALSMCLQSPQAYPIARQLLSLGADPHAKAEPFGFEPDYPIATAFQLAVTSVPSDLIEIMLTSIPRQDREMLLAQSYRYPYKARKQPAALHALESDQLNTASILFAIHPAIVGWYVSDREESISALFIAVQRNNLCWVRKILKNIQSADFKSQNPDFLLKDYLDLIVPSDNRAQPQFFSALGLALCMKYFEIAEALIDAGASINTTAWQKGDYSNSAFSLFFCQAFNLTLVEHALQRQTADTIKSLLDKSLNIVALQQTYESPMEYQKIYGQSQRLCANVPLIFCLQSQNLSLREYAPLFVAFGANIFIRAKSGGSTALWEAAIQQKNLVATRAICMRLQTDRSRSPQDKLEYLNYQAFFTASDGNLEYISVAKHMAKKAKAENRSATGGGIFVETERAILQESFTAEYSETLGLLNASPAPLLYALLSENQILGLKILDSIKRYPMPTQQQLDFLCHLHVLSSFPEDYYSFLGLSLRSSELEALSIELIQAGAVVHKVAETYGHPISLFEMLCVAKGPARPAIFEKAILSLLRSSHSEFFNRVELQHDGQIEPLIATCMRSQKNQVYALLLLKHKIGLWAESYDKKNLIGLALTYDASLELIETIILNVIEDTRATVSEKIDYLKKRIPFADGSLKTPYDFACEKKLRCSALIHRAIDCLSISVATDTPALMSGSNPIVLSPEGRRTLRVPAQQAEDNIQTCNKTVIKSTR